MKQQGLVMLMVTTFLSGCSFIHYTTVMNSPVVAAATQGEPDTTAAEKVVSAFHSDFNAENFEGIYTTAHSDFKATMTKDELLGVFQSKRAKLGKVVSSTKLDSHEKTVETKTSLVVSYSTTYENGSRKEVFVLGTDNEANSLIGWHLGTDPQKK